MAAAESGTRRRTAPTIALSTIIAAVVGHRRELPDHMCRGASLPNRSYEKGRRFEGHVAKFFRRFFGQFGKCERSFMSRGVDVGFVDYLMRVWRVSCKCMKLPKKIWDELEGHDIVAIHQDYKPKAYVIIEDKLAELLGEETAKRLKEELA